MPTEKPDQNGWAILRDTSGPTVAVPCLAPKSRVPSTLEHDGQTRKVWKWTKDQAIAIKLAARFAQAQTERELQMVEINRKRLEMAKAAADKMAAKVAAKKGGDR